jgi:hypothetical protein
MGGRRTLGQGSPHAASPSRVLGRQRPHRRALLKSERVFNVIAWELPSMAKPGMPSWLATEGTGRSVATKQVLVEAGLGWRVD